MTSIYGNRSPSLCGTTSTSSDGSSLPVTPDFDEISSFPVNELRTKDMYSNSPSLLPYHLGGGVDLNQRGSIGSLSDLARGLPKTSSRVPWTPGHRAGSASVDSGRNKSSPFHFDKETTPTRSSIHLTTPTKLSSTPGRRGVSPTPYSPSSASLRSPTSPSAPASPSSARTLSSAIFSTRDPALPASPLLIRGHRRAQTLPPSLAEFVDEEAPSVSGLPGRIRLSRPVDSPSPFAPSSVFSSARYGSALESASPKSSPQRPASVYSATSPRPASVYGGISTVKAMDQQRQNLVVYEYLCHVAEARQWLDENITSRDSSTPLWNDSIIDFEQSLRNGYALAHLARSLGGTEGAIYIHPELQFRHTDNIVMFFKFVASVGLPEIFRFETLDLYNAKDLPKVIFCIHALSHLLARGSGVQGVTSLSGQIEFTDAEVSATQTEIGGTRLPNFKGIGKAMSRQFNEEVFDSPRAPKPEIVVPSQETIRQNALDEFNSIAPCIQAHIRGTLARKAIADITRNTRQTRVVRSTGSSASLARLSQRRSQDRNTKDFDFIEPELIGFQAFARGLLSRRKHEAVKMQVANAERHRAVGRSRIGGGGDRAKMERMRSQAAREAAVQSKIPDEAEADHREELEIERLQQAAFELDQDVRRAQQVVIKLDSKIALLVRNKIMCDRAAAQKASSSSASSARDLIALTSSASPDDLLDVSTPPIPAPDRLTEDEELFRQAKRYVRAILQVQQGKNLEVVLVSTVSEEDENEWQSTITEAQQRSMASQSSRRSTVALVNDLYDLTFQELKVQALSIVMELRNRKLVSSKDKYQSLLAAIADDIRSSERRRQERQEDIGIYRTNINTLNEKLNSLIEIHKAYLVYFKSSTSGMQHLKSQFSMPFSRQSRHLAQLKRSGQSYQFGSFNYNLEKLCDRGVVLRMNNVSPKVYNLFSLTISSSEIGVFELNCVGKESLTTEELEQPNWRVEIKLERLLDAQSRGKTIFPISNYLDTNLANLLALINRKFFS